MNDVTATSNAARIVLENNGFDVEEIAEGGGFRITKPTGTASIEASTVAVDEAQELVDAVWGGDGPEVRFPVEGGREGQMTAEMYWM